MQDHLKERLTGAAILVVIVVPFVEIMGRHEDKARIARLVGKNDSQRCSLHGIGIFIRIGIEHVIASERRELLRPFVPDI